MVKKILIAVGVLIALLLVVGMLLPRAVHVERSITIDAAPADIWPLIASFDGHHKWSPWDGRDPGMDRKVTGEPGKIGHRLEWHSEKSDVGSGNQEVTEIKANERFVTALDFGSEGKAVATLDLKADGAGTKVTWGLDSDMGAGPIGRLFGPMMDGMIGPDYETGLASLKKLAEAGEGKKMAGAPAADAPDAASPTAN